MLAGDRGERAERRADARANPSQTSPLPVTSTTPTAPAEPRRRARSDMRLHDLGQIVRGIERRTIRREAMDERERDRRGFRLAQAEQRLAASERELGEQRRRDRRRDIEQLLLAALRVFLGLEETPN